MQITLHTDCQTQQLLMALLRLPQTTDNHNTLLYTAADTKMNRLLASMPGLISALLVSALPLTATFSLHSNTLHVSVSVASVSRRNGFLTTTSLASAAPSDTSTDDIIIPPSVESASERVENCKSELIQMCNGHELGSGSSVNIESKIKELEQLGEDAGFGQASSLSGLISGEW